MIGGTLQSVGQVVASGAMVNEHTKDLATIFKIVRIIFLVVVVFVLGNLKNKESLLIYGDIKIVVLTMKRHIKDI